MMHNLKQALAQRWNEASAREQSAMKFSATLVLLALLWWIGLQPALSTIKSTRVQMPLVRAQYEQMLQLQAQAGALRAQAQQAVPDAKALLQESVSSLEKNARWTALGERATVTFKEVRPADLARWLEQVRLKAHSRVLEMHISQTTGLWSGAVVLQLPASQGH